jgi:hypothetical protein
MITSDLLYKKYITENKSSIDIGKELNKSKPFILNLLHRFSIPIRHGSKAKIGRPSNSSSQFKKQHIPWNKNKKGIYSKEYREKISIAASKRIGKLNPNFGNHKLKGKNNPGYIHGQAQRGYSYEFRIIRNKIRKRDNSQCQYCGLLEANHKRELCVHHIDYNKENNTDSNLITLCIPCHLDTNFNRDYWYAYYIYIMEERQ